MQRYVDSVGYGNGDISGPIGLFWLDGPLMISPMEQIEFLVRLYRNDLPFSMRTMEIVRRILPMEASDEFVLKAKTGWAQRGNTHVGWWVGWVERRDRAYFFATVLHTDRPGENFGQVRLALTRQILKELKILP